MPRIIVDENRCKGCELCINVCPRGCIAVSATFSATGYYPAMLAKEECCTGCGMCYLVCPDVAIEVWKPERPEDRTGE